jgi:hypothetical protein
MATAPKSVEVIGLRELTTAFRQVDREFARELRVAFKLIADHVVGEAQQKMPFITGDAAKSFKPRSTDRGAEIIYPRGGPFSARDPVGYVPWLDYGGGREGARGITASSPIAHAKSSGGFKREHRPKGRFLYPAIAESRGYIEQEVYRAVEGVSQNAGFGTGRE